MYRLVIILSFFILSCNTVANTHKNNISIKDIELDSVEKELLFNEKLPDEITDLFYLWFTKNIKTTGINGKSTVTVSNYNEDATIIDNGKKIKISVDLKIQTIKDSLPNKHTKNINVFEEAKIEGDFSINDFELLRKQAVVNLINRITDELSKG